MADADFSIRPATEDEVPLILTFIKELAEVEKLSHEAVATEQGLRETLFGETRYAEVILGFDHEEPLGRPGLYLEDLCIRPEARGKGFGRAMLQHLAGIAKQRNCGRMEWWVLDWNEPAIQFYKKLGAVPMKDWTVSRLTGRALDKLSHSEN